MSSPQQQRGFGAVIFVALIALLAIGVLMTVLAGKSAQNEFDEKTLPVLAVAQKSLIAYAAANPTPGRLPCADTDNDGVEDCGGPAGNQLGRLPWKTLGLPDLRDGAGECLWYAVSGTFRESPLTTPVNSDTNGQLIVKDASGNTLAGNAIAVILAPGPALPGVTRTPGTAQCPGATAVITFADASTYLDVANAINNATSPPATLVVSQPSDTFNDRLVFITPAQFFPAVERRVAGEIKKILLAYYAANGYYPFANDLSDGSYNCTPSPPDHTRGRLPLTISTSCPGLADWPAGLPGWFTSDQWHLLTYYTVAPACTSSTPTCSGAGFLTVQNGPTPTGNAQALVIEPGPSLPALGQPSPCGAAANCLDGAENTNGDDIYITQSPSPTFNDVVVIVAP